ncbi:hypothetical protein H7R52_06060 [Weissella confusa]|uniref:Uncharacterized protein n=1 Tax=Weissella confusa TaxID=1583 RepID=A0A923SMV4_WEICO|nr:hypothetical protein [Weissella confusa]
MGDTDTEMIEEEFEQAVAKLNDNLNLAKVDDLHDRSNVGCRRRNCVPLIEHLLKLSH